MKKDSPFQIFVTKLLKTFQREPPTGPRDQVPPVERRNLDDNTGAGEFLGRRKDDNVGGEG